ncbi:MAG: helix-turn-helix domain-containing protein [Methylohalobius sp. ZOD2]
MNEPIKFQTILGPDGKPAFVVIPYEEFRKRYDLEHPLIPNEVVGMVVEDNLTPIRAWREYLGLTQAEVARRMGVTQAAFAQLETSKRPRKSTLRRVADALELSFEQLDF